MSNILISLVSDQRMQNILPVFQRGARYDSVLLIVSAKNGGFNPKFKDIASDLTTALAGRIKVQLHQEPVDPFDPGSTYDVIGGILGRGRATDTYTVNYTGGAKTMAVGAYMAAVEHGAHRLYVDTSNERFLLNKPDASLERIPFDIIAIPIPTYFAAHRRRILVDRTKQGEFSKAELAIAAGILAEGKTGLRVADHLHTAAVKGSQSRIRIPYTLREQMQAYDLLKDGYLTPAGSKYFRSGRWLEAYTYQSLLGSGVFDEVAGPQWLEADGGVINEIDCTATASGKLALLECKSRLLSRRRTGYPYDENAQQILGKLKSLRDVIGGVFGRAFVVTSQYENHISPLVFKRAKEYRLQIIGHEGLERLPELIYPALTRRPFGSLPTA